MFDETMKLALGWSVVVAFIFTLGITLLSLVGWVKFAYPKQQQGLYAALILEVVVGSIAGLRFNPVAVGDENREEGREEGIEDGRAEGVLAAVDLRLAAVQEGLAPAKREELLRMLDLAEAKVGSPLAEEKLMLRSKIEELPPGIVAPEAAEAIRMPPRSLDARALRRGRL